MDRYELLAILVLSLSLIPVGYLVFIFVIVPLKFHIDEKRHPRKKIDDPVFGHIEFDDYLWSHIPVEDNEHMVCVVAPSTGPTQQQRNFYISLREDLSSRESECKAFISQQESPPGNLADMTLYSIEIGPVEECENGQFVIELSDEEANEIHRVEFKNGRPETYGVDD